MKRTLASWLLPAAVLPLGCAMALSQNEGEARPLPAIDKAAPEKLETATFALGWFWHPQAQFGALPGVVRSRVGYCGGTKKNPTYYKIGDHTETLQIEYDPKVISYEKIMEAFWSAHNPCARAGSRQYMTAVFYHNEAQKKAALAARDKVAARLGQRIETTVLPLTEFYLAEDYHQLYYLRNRPEFLREFKAMYPEEKDFRRSTAAMRVNAFLGNYGTPATLEKELPGYGLSGQAAAMVQEEVKRRR